jgi:hypothetical protein
MVLGEVDVGRSLDLDGEQRVRIDRAPVDRLEDGIGVALTNGGVGDRDGAAVELEVAALASRSHCGVITVIRESRSRSFDFRELRIIPSSSVPSGK